MALKYKSNPHTESARHYCRKAGCGFVVEPEPKAHQTLRAHRVNVHGFAAIAAYCNAECGYRARPSEGRYTETELAHSTWLGTGPTE